MGWVFSENEALIYNESESNKAKVYGVVWKCNIIYFTTILFKVTKDLKPFSLVLDLLTESSLWWQQMEQVEVPSIIAAWNNIFCNP